MMVKKSKEDRKSDCCVICDEKYPVSIFNTTVKPICNQNELENCNLVEFEIIFILAELKWSGFIRSNFYGFKLAADLRNNKHLRCPIVLCSFMPSFDQEQYPDSKILDYPGHYLLQLPNMPFSFDNYKGIDEDTLEDICITLFDTNQYIHDLMHNTENRCPELVYRINKIEGKYDIDGIKKEVNDYLYNQLEIIKLEILKHNILAEKISDFDALRAKLLNEVNSTIDKDEFDPEELRSPLNIYKDQFYSLLPYNNYELDFIKATPKRWQVLFVDDIPSSCNVIQSHFERNGISCHTAQTAEDVFTKLRVDEDGAKMIAVVITDFRLYKDGNEGGKWQDLQGFQILKRIHSHNEFKSHYSYVMLTSKKGTIQQHIKKQSKFPILWFNKADVLAGKKHSFNIFCQRIVELGSESFFKKHIIPAFGGWKNAIPGKVDADFNYRNLYKLHIEDVNYDRIEAEINDLTEQYSQMNEFPDGFSLAPSFKKKDQPDKMVSLFRSTILLYRRVFLKLKFVNKKTDKEIFKFFKPHYTPGTEIKNDSESSSKRSLSSEELKESQWIESIKGLFYINWGFQLDIEDKKIAKNVVNNPNKKYLQEEFNFLNNLGLEFPKIDTDDEIELISFFDDIFSFIWSIETKLKVSAVRDKLNKEIEVRFDEVRKLFFELREECLNNEELDKQVRETYFIRSYMNSSDFISQELSEIVDNFLEEK